MKIYLVTKSDAFISPNKKHALKRKIFGNPVQIHHLWQKYQADMNTLPPAFEQRIRRQLGSEVEAFLQALNTSAPVSIRLNPGKTPIPVDPSTTGNGTQPVPWCPEGLYLPERPAFTLDPLLHGGAYYVQEASSMFFAHVLRQLLPATPVRMLDLCAAPGGKSTLAAALLPPGSLLVANEVIRSRAAILRENIIKWGQDNIVVTNNDPAGFAPLEGAFDLILVDAPCSGEGMFRKDPAAIAEWSEANARLCAERQRRILADIWQCLRPGGTLVYSTCTYNPDEDEAILEWLLSEWDAETIPLPCPFPGVTPAESPACAFRFYPHKTAGEGFFIGAVRKTGGKPFTPRKPKKGKTGNITPLPPALKPYLLHPEQYAAYTLDGTTGILPAAHASFIETLGSTLRILYQGCEIAEANNRKIKLLHPAALWQGLNRDACTPYPVELPAALAYLRKEDLPVPTTPADWLLVTYRGIPLGWCKHLGTRLNNYYPKEWRIRMQAP